MRVVSLLNRKGGVGKTSTCHHLAGTLARRGLRVLLVDCDPQASLTQGLLGPAVARALDPALTVATLFDGGREPDAAPLVRATSVPGVSLLPGSTALDLYNAPEPWGAGDVQHALGDGLACVARGFDLALLDCPPTLYMAAWAALLASDGVVVPLQPEDYGAQGVAEIQGGIARAATINARLKLLGFLVTMYQARTIIHQDYDRDLRDLYGADVFAARVPYAMHFKEAVMKRQPIVAYKPRSVAARSIDALAHELIGRLDSRCGAAGVAA